MERSKQEIINSVLRGAELSISLLTGQPVMLSIQTGKINMPGGWEEMMGVICKALGMTMDDYFETKLPEINRKPNDHGVKYGEFCDLRCIASALVGQYYPEVSLQMLAKAMGGFHHSSIIFYRRKHEANMNTGKAVYCSKYRKVIKAIDAWQNGDDIVDIENKKYEPIEN